MKQNLTTTVPTAQMAIEQDIRRVDLILRNVDHLGCTYEGRVFFNNKRAGPNTELTTKAGYACSFYIFGHGDCYGAPDHCSVPQFVDPYDTTIFPPESLPTEVHLTVTEAFVRAVKGKKRLSVTIVPVVCEHPKYVSSEPEDALKFGKASFAIYS